MAEAADAIDALRSAADSSGFDAMPTLIRVATDLYVGRDSPTLEESRRFEELMLGLLEAADLPTRAIVARKLAPCPTAPGAVLAKLLMDDMEVASAILSLSPRVPRDALFDLAIDGDAAGAAAVARRADLEPELVRILAFHPAPAVTEALAENPHLVLDRDLAQEFVARATTRGSLARLLLARRDIDLADLAPLYLSADAETRQAIREAVGRESTGGRPHEQPPRVPDAADTALIETVAASGQPDMLADALALAFGIGLAQAKKLVEEPSGEALAIALVAAGLSCEAIGRVLLCAKPPIAASVPRFFALVELAGDMSRAAALRLTAAMTSAQPAETARHAAYLAPGETTVRPLRERAAAQVPVADRRRA
jgi:uncharacterized protein (DUF2336 family)